MGTKEIKSFIEKIELFKGLNESELQLIADHFEDKSYPVNSIIFEENQPRRHFFVVYSGEIELFKTGDNGQKHSLAIFGRSDFFGEGSLMDDSPHSTSARVKKEAQLLLLNRDVFSQNGDLAIKVFSNIARVISRRMRQANAHMLNSAAQYESGRTRKEHDLLGYREVPDEYYYGIQTLRAMENFNISGVTLNFFPDLIESLAIVKMAAAKANYDLGLLEKPVANAIIQACRELMNGRFHYHFTVDMIQGGAGTSTNMNANEVIANRALEIMGYEKGDYEHCHPNNHVNLSQSTNDAYPTAIKLALIKSDGKLIAVLKELIEAFYAKAKAFAHVIKMGRTQLQDAVPMTLGQSFEAYAITLEEEVERLQQNSRLFLEVNMGATAIGTGINSDPDYCGKVIHHLREISGMEIVRAKNLVEATSDTGAFVMYSSAIKRLSIKLSKICNDLRLLSSGPRAGLNEINLPPMQPGSSIMPGKVNPVIPEVVNQIAFKVIGNDLTVAQAAHAGQLELNVMEPVIVQSIFESTEMLKNGMDVLNHKCIQGITANEKRCREMVENSIGLVTALNPLLGYEACSSLAREALETGKSVYNLVLERDLLTKEALDEALKPENMIGPKKMGR